MPPPNGGLVAQWITRLTTDQKIPGSNPGELDYLSSYFETSTCTKKAII